MRPEPRPELLRELDPLLHAVVHVRVVVRIKLTVLRCLHRGLQHLEPGRIVRAGLCHLVVIPGEAADVLGQLLKRRPLLRALQHHSEAALGDARIQFCDVGVPGRIRRFVASDVVVRPSSEIIQVFHGEQLLPEPITRHRQRFPAELLLQLPHQLVPAVGERELGTTFQFAGLSSPTCDLVARQQRMLPEEGFRLHRGKSERPVHPLRQFHVVVLHRERPQQIRVPKRREEPLGQSRVRVDERPPRTPILRVELRRPGLHQLLEPLDRGPEILARPPVGVADTAQHPTQHQAVTISTRSRVPGDRGVRVHRQRIHYRLVRRDRRRATVRIQIAREDREIVPVVLPLLVGRMRPQRPHLVLPGQLILVPQPRRELVDRDVPAEHPGIPTQQVLHRERPEHLDERLPVVAVSQPVVLRLQLGLRLQQRLIPRFEACSLHPQQELRQRDLARAQRVLRPAVAVLVEHHLWDADVCYQRQCHLPATRQVSGLCAHQTHQHLQHVRGNLVTPEHPLRRGFRILTGQHLVQLHQPGNRLALIQLRTQLRAGPVGVMQLLELAEHVRPERVQEQHLRPRRR